MHTVKLRPKHFQPQLTIYSIVLSCHLRSTCGRGVGEDGEGADVLRSVSCSSGQQCSLWTRKKWPNKNTLRKSRLPPNQAQNWWMDNDPALTWTTSGLRSCLFRGFRCLERKRSDCICEKKKRKKHILMLVNTSIMSLYSWHKQKMMHYSGLHWSSRAAVWRLALPLC